MPVDVLTQVDVELQIIAVSDALEEEVHRYADVAEIAAVAEADFQLAYHRAYIACATSSDQRMTNAEREAHAHLRADNLFKAWKITAAREAASKQAQYSLRSRLDALRTLAANIRHAT